MDAQTIPIPTTTDAHARVAAINEVLRDIARGGLAGLLVGVVLAGIGGRLVMRLAALVVPEATGRLTENGNVIGSITLGGTLGLVMFIGLVFGVVAGSLWVVLRPWLPAGRWQRALLATVLALALGARGLIVRDNPDFAVLGRHPVVVGSLVVLVALFGPGLVLAETWLERRLPHPTVREDPAARGYLAVTLLGVFLTIFLVAPVYLGGELVLAGIALIVVGVATLASWWRRMQRKGLPAWVSWAARVAVVIAAVAGLAVSARHLEGVLALS
jgi:hypothetical protein